MQILHVVGTRPNLVKMAPVIAALRERFPDWPALVVHTGQHYDRLMSEIFLEELGVPEPDHMLGVGSGSHAEQIAGILERSSRCSRAERPDLVIVPGDVNSTARRGALRGEAGIAVAHVESGLRSFDRTMPEEMNRVLTDRSPTCCFLHSTRRSRTCAPRGSTESRIRFVGNTMIDTLVALEGPDPRARRRRDARPRARVATCWSRCTGRPSSTGRCCAEAMRRLSEVGRELPVLFPVHPRTRKMLDGGRLSRRHR